MSLPNGIYTIKSSNVIYIILMKQPIDIANLLYLLKITNPNKITMMKMMISLLIIISETTVITKYVEIQQFQTVMRVYPRHIREILSYY